ncbi:MAG: HAD family hydrolase [Eubacteriales bacterium]
MNTQEKAVKALIFDKDGTLHDTERVFHDAWRLAAKDLRVPDIETTIRDCTGRNIQDIQQYWETKYPDIPFAAYYALRTRYFNQLTEQGIPVKEGAVQLLKTLRERGYLLALATSTGHKAAMEHLRRTGMEGLFDAMIFGDMVQRGKPAPDIYLTAAGALGLSPEVCVGVEDSPNGVLSVHNAGMRAIMVPDLTAPTPDIEAVLWDRCDCLLDILRVLDERDPRPAGEAPRP